MGNISVYSGPMKCGKSSKLIKKAYEFENKGAKIAVFKPIIDDRFSSNNVVDRNGNYHNAININKIDDVEKVDADAYFIDEFQFLYGDVNAIKRLSNKGKKIFVAGLNLTSDNKPFGKMNEIFEMSDNTIMMNAMCENCGKDNAIYSYCKVNKENEILVGDADYIPVCEECYMKLINNIN